MEPTVIDAGECTAADVLESLKDGDRIVVRTEFLGSTHKVILRWDGDTFYCDTPTRLHKHDTEDEMLSCIVRQGYCSDG